MQNFVWKKRGLIYCLDARLPWGKSHAQIPTFGGRSGDKLRIFFSSRDANNRSLIARLDVNQNDLLSISRVFGDPVMQLGRLGAFDDCGMMPSSVVEFNNKYYLYYIGWNVRNTIPYHNSIGLAVSEDGGESYQRLFDGPIMERTADEPYFCATTCVRIENGIWRNWYLSSTGWDYVDGRPEPRYHLKYAESLDGIHWKRGGRIAVDYASDQEGGIVRASVHREGNLWHMWYSYRQQRAYRSTSSESYRIGYAESSDGLSWRRNDDMAGIDISLAGWDSFMIAYPEVFAIDERLIMLYNGNGFGLSGFGYAELINVSKNMKC